MNYWITFCQLANFIRAKSLAVNPFFLTILGAITLSFSHAAPAEETLRFKCPVQQIYHVSRGRSVDVTDELFFISVRGDRLILESDGDRDLLTVEHANDFEISAKNDNMIVMVRPGSGQFLVHAGIGKSGFDMASGGHTGKQVRFFGMCTKK